MCRRLIVVSIGSLLLVAHLAGQGDRTYPAARQGGNYMHNYYFAPAPSSTPWAPAWSPDGTSLAVAMSGSIWTIDRRIGQRARAHLQPQVPLDARLVARRALDCVRRRRWRRHDPAGDRERRDRREPRADRPTTQIYMDPVFSPDGTRLAYVATKPSGNFNVFIRSIKDGQFAGDEIAVTRDNDFGRDRLYFGRMDMHITPAWLPDGKELLLVSNRNVPLGSGNVLRVPAAANGIDKATTVLAEQTLYRTRPHVSLDGKRFVYSSTRAARRTSSTTCTCSRPRAASRTS